MNDITKLLDEVDSRIKHHIELGKEYNKLFEEELYLIDKLATIRERMNMISDFRAKNTPYTEPESLVLLAYISSRMKHFQETL